MKSPYILFFVLSILFLSCKPENTKNVESRDSSYIESIENWRKARVDRLTSGSSWLALAGLFPLEVGENSFGSSVENKIRFPKKAAAKMGSFYLDGDTVMMTVRAEVDIMQDSILVKMASMQADSTGQSPTFHYGSLNWNLLQRGGKYYVRLRDTLNEAIQEFTSINYFDIDPTWMLEANFIPFVSPKTTTYQNVLGMALEMNIEGRLEFKIADQFYSLEVLDGGPEDFFIIFEDGTTGKVLMVVVAIFMYQDQTQQIKQSLILTRLIIHLAHLLNLQPAYYRLQKTN